MLINSKNNPIKSNQNKTKKLYLLRTQIIGLKDDLANWNMKALWTTWFGLYEDWNNNQHNRPFQREVTISEALMGI